MSKRAKLHKQAKQEEKLKNKYRPLIEELLYGLDEYGVQFEIVDNDQAKYFEDSDSEFLRCPLAVKFTIPNSEHYTQGGYSDMMYLNEQGSGFEFWHEDIAISVDEPSFFFIGYANRLENEIRRLKECSKHTS